MKIHWKIKAGRAKIGIFQKMRNKNLMGGQWGTILKNSTPSPWKRRITTSSAIFCATGAWGLILLKFSITSKLYDFDEIFHYHLTFIPQTIISRILVKKIIILNPKIKFKVAIVKLTLTIISALHRIWCISKKDSLRQSINKEISEKKDFKTPVS